ncbi:MAG: hypothetical protein AAFV53_14515 [Myxococcota bacterium]
MKIKSTRAISRIHGNPRRAPEERVSEAFSHEQAAVVHISPEARERLHERNEDAAEQKKKRD